MYPGADTKIPSEKAPQAAEGAAKARQGWGCSGFLGRPCWGQVPCGTASTRRKAWGRVGCPPAIRGSRQHGHLCLSALQACALPPCSMPSCGQQPWHLHPLASRRVHPAGTLAGDVRGTHRRNTGAVTFPQLGLPHPQALTTLMVVRTPLLAQAPPFALALQARGSQSYAALIKPHQVWPLTRTLQSPV